MYITAHQNYSAVDVFLPSVWKGELWVAFFQYCSHLIATFFPSTNIVSHYICMHRDLHADAGGRSAAVLPHGSVTDVPAGTIWLLAELMPFWPWSAVSSKSLFSLSHKSWKWTVSILRPYIAFSFFFSLPMHLITFHNPNKSVPIINHRPSVSVNQWCSITSNFQRPKKPL